MSLVDVIRVPVVFLNQPEIKAGAKELFGIATCALSVAVLMWPREKANDIAWRAMEDVSLVLSIVSSRAGLRLSGWAISALLSEQTLSSWFGMYTIFQVNPIHPRHLLSFAAVILALPARVQAVKAAGSWIQGKRTPKGLLREATVTFNTVTSRPVLHTVNRLLLG